jgi:hypothetical protein
MAYAPTITTSGVLVARVVDALEDVAAVVVVVVVVDGGKRKEKKGVSEVSLTVCQINSSHPATLKRSARLSRLYFKLLHRRARRARR